MHKCVYFPIISVGYSEMRVKLKKKTEQISITNKRRVSSLNSVFFNMFRLKWFFFWWMVKRKTGTEDKNGRKMKKKNRKLKKFQIDRKY